MISPYKKKKKKVVISLSKDAMRSSSCKIEWYKSRHV
jgi:hypothetical protein